MYQTDWIIEFRQKLAAEDGLPCSKEDEADETSPIIRRWLMLADQFLSTDSSEAKPA